MSKKTDNAARFRARNFSNPLGDVGIEIMEQMNEGHAALTHWSLSWIELRPHDTVLDIGCGGGNAVRIMAKSSESVFGVDHSADAVRFASELNARAVADGRVTIQKASVSKLPFEDASFDYVTAFETVFFWPDPIHDYQEVRRVLKPSGIFLIGIDTPLDEASKKDLEHEIPGMKLPTPPELISQLFRAGFAEVAIHEESGLESDETSAPTKHMYCFEARNAEFSLTESEKAMMERLRTNRDPAHDGRQG